MVNVTDIDDDDRQTKHCSISATVNGRLKTIDLFDYAESQETTSGD